MNTASQGALPSVLVVDDDEFSQEVFLMTLGGLGVTDIHLACNGLDGLRTLKGMQHPPDFLICDIFMPDMDGIEFLDQLGKRGYQGGIILVSGGSFEMMAIARKIAIADGLKLLGAFIKPLLREPLGQVMGLCPVS